MPNQIFVDTTAFFNGLQTRYREANIDYCIDFLITERIKQHKPNVEADFTYIYEQIPLLAPLNKGVLQAINDYKQKNILLRSKKEINEFIESLKKPYQFFEDILKDFSKKIAEIDYTIEQERGKFALLNNFQGLARCIESAPQHDNKMRNSAFVIDLLIQQKHSLYAFSKVALLSHEMLSETLTICQRVKKESLLFPKEHFVKVDVWMEQYERERPTELNVATSLNHHMLKNLTQRLTGYNNLSGRIYVTPLKRYKLENRVQAQPAPQPVAQAVTTRSTAAPAQVRAMQSILTAGNAYKMNVAQLKVKINQLLGKARSNNNYRDVAHTAEVLISELEKAQVFFKNDSPVTKKGINEFVQTCQKAIDVARADFGEHRSFLEQLNPILKNILGVLAAVTIVMAIVVEVKSKHGYVGTFFRAHDTDSLEKLDKFTAKTAAILDELSNKVPTP